VIFDPSQPGVLERAVEALLAGGVVGMPTETVYGLAADASSPQAVARIYAIKGRPLDHPVIVHVADVEQAALWAREIPAYARALIEEFWPGPLTLILPRSGKAGDWVTGGQDSVGLRSPSHPVAQALLRRCGFGLAAPSANRFGRVSATSASAVEEELSIHMDHTLDLILDGGESDVGVESTIVDCTGDHPAILRLGAITISQIEQVSGLSVVEANTAVRAPGTLEQHYSPTAKVVLDEMPHLGDGLIAMDSIATPEGVVRLAAPATVEEYAHELYAALRRADSLGLPTVYVMSPTGDDLAAAIRDRLIRASSS
jgi:L-threonylcarbamoyladenylate synthase